MFPFLSPFSEGVINVAIERSIERMQAVIELVRVLRDRKTMPTKVSVCTVWSLLFFVSCFSSSFILYVFNASSMLTIIAAATAVAVVLFHQGILLQNFLATAFTFLYVPLLLLLQYPLPEVVVIHRDQQYLDDVQSLEQYILEVSCYCCSSGLFYDENHLLSHAFDCCEHVKKYSFGLILQITLKYMY